MLQLIRDFRDNVAPTRDITVSLKGFHDHYELKNEVQFVDFSTRELLDRMTPTQALEVLQSGNQRFRSGQRLTRDFARQVAETAESQHPYAAVLSCIDSRVPAEIVFDVGIGEIYSVRVAGNVVGKNLLGSLEYAAVVSGVKVLVVMGHKHCGAITASLNLLSANTDVAKTTGCPNLPVIVNQIAPNVSAAESVSFGKMSVKQKDTFADIVAQRNVLHVVAEIKRRSSPIRIAAEAGDLMVVGAIYDVADGTVTFV